MGRGFTAASLHKLAVTGAPVTGYPFTVAGWGWSSEGAAIKTAFSLVDESVGNRYHTLQVDSTERVRYRCNGPEGVQNSLTATGVFNLSAWNHIAMVGTSSTSRDVWCNGTVGTTGTTDITPTGIDGMAIGVLNDSSPSDFWEDFLGEFCLWNVALADAEIIALANRVHSSRIRPASIVPGGYWPCYGVGSPEPDYSGQANHMIVTGATVAKHPPVGPPAWAGDSEPYVVSAGALPDVGWLPQAERPYFLKRGVMSY